MSTVVSRTENLFPSFNLRRSEGSKLSIRNVIFDFGGVLLRWQPQEIIKRFYADERTRELLRAHVFQHPDWIELDRGILDDEAAAHRFAARMERSPGEMHALLQAVRESLTPIEESFALARDLNRRGVPLYGLSNMSASNFAYLRQRYDHWQLFRGIVISGEVKLMKPEPAIFEHICRLYRLDPTETVFIDDHQPNIDAARRLGFRTVLFRDPRQCRDDLEILIGR
jgi:putative hydrolase of the HAD superfamily